MADTESGLTEQQERFCQAIVAGMNQTDAYKAAGYKGAYKSLKDNAARLIANDSVARRIAELRKPIADKAAVTLAWLIGQAQEVLAAARADNAHAASIAAIKELGILSGERIETRHNLNQDANEPTDLSRAELLAIARAGSKGAASPGDGAGKPDRVHKVH